MLITYQQDPIPNVCNQNVHLFIAMTGTRKRCLEANIEASITERTVPGARHLAGNRGVKVKVNVNININAS